MDRPAFIDADRAAPGLWFMEEIDLYKVLCPHKLRDYTRDHFIDVGKDEPIYEVFDTTRKVYLVSRGKVKLTRYTREGNEIVLAVLRRGELFGFNGLLGRDKQQENAVGVTPDTRVCTIELPDIYDLMRKNERFSLSLFKLLGLRIRRIERRLELLFFKDTVTRLIDFLFDLREHAGVHDGEAIRHFYTHKDIAGIIGTGRETVTKLLRRLQADGLIRYGRKEFVILDPAGLGAKRSTAHI